jgi:UDP-glucuronate decarboxylase
MSELAEKVIHFTDSKSKLIYMPLPQDNPQLRQTNIDLAREKLDWEPTVSLDDGLKETVSYFKNNLG